VPAAQLGFLREANDLFFCKLLFHVQSPVFGIGLKAQLLLKSRGTSDSPDCVWVTNITYIRTWQGWLYLAVVLDALMMVVWPRKLTQEVIVHSDQGSQYGSDDWKRFCDANR
jgi:transposase InsO family protein